MAHAIDFDELDFADRPAIRKLLIHWGGKPEDVEALEDAVEEGLSFAPITSRFRHAWHPDAHFLACCYAQVLAGPRRRRRRPSRTAKKERAAGEAVLGIDSQKTHSAMGPTGSRETP